jgi:RimJ/RimL family protein N-acetyltransferase
MALVMYKVFREFGAHRLWLDVIDDNVRAQHVYRKLGFVEEGRLREAAKRKDGWRDLLLFGMLAADYGKRG